MGSLFAFVVTGSLVGCLLIIWEALNEGISTRAFAAVSAYAFACELYMFMFTLVSSSVSVGVLLRLTRGALDGAGVDSAYSGERLVQVRLEKMIVKGLLEHGEGTLVLTPKGRRLLLSFERMRGWIGRTASQSSGETWSDHSPAVAER